jgi:hypothetical protein
MLDPQQNGTRRNIDPALGHYFGEISVREFVLEVPADAQRDDLGIEMAALEELVEAPAACSPGPPFHEGIVEHLPQRAVCNRTVQVNIEICLLGQIWNGGPSPQDFLGVSYFVFPSTATKLDIRTRTRTLDSPSNALRAKRGRASTSLAKVEDDGRPKVV